MLIILLFFLKKALYTKHFFLLNCILITALDEYTTLSQLKVMELSKMKLARSCALSLSSDPAYVLGFASQKKFEQSNSLFAAAVSGTNEVKIYSKETFCSQGSLSGHEARVTAIKFDILNSDIIWSCSLDGTLRFWDMEGSAFKDNIVSQKDIAYTCFDINCDGTILAAGMEKIETDSIEDKSQKKAFVTVELWDISDIKKKSPVRLCEFDSIHSDDITTIVFHPKDPKLLVTGSTDGLVTVLNVSSTEEDTALIQTLNPESSVNIAGYFGSSLEFLYVLTDIETFTIWKYMEGELLTDVIDLKKKFSDCNKIEYVIDCLYHETSERLFLVGGARDGRIEVLHINLDMIEPYFTLKGGHSSIVRCISYESGCLLTGAEDGMVCAWMELENVRDSSNKDGIKSVKKSRKTKRKEKPYKVGQ